MTDQLDNLDNIELPDDEVVTDTTTENKPQTTKSRTKLYFWLFVLFIITATGGIVTKTAMASMTSKYVVDKRSCEYKQKGVTVSGMRYYSYRYTEVFGVRLIDAEKISERTDIHHEFIATVVVGMNDLEWWSLNLGKGEPTIKTLGKATSYTFVQDGLAGVVSYDDFCK